MNKQIYIMEPIQDYLENCDLDFLIMAASSNVRSYKSLEFIGQKGTDINNIIMLDFTESSPTQDSPYFNDYHAYSKMGIHITTISCDQNSINFDSLGISENSKIAIDITGLNIPSLYRIIFILSEVFGINQLHIFYTEPQFYVFEQGMLDAYEYLIGDRKYNVIEEYFNSGENNKEVLVIFLGFDRMTSSMVKDEVNPSITYLINGFPSTSPKLKDISLLNNYELIKKITPQIYNTKANNPFSAYNILSEIQRKHLNELLNICVLGSKPMALGSCLFVLHNKLNVKLSYAFQKGFKERISEGAATTWHYEISTN
ncbi:MAG: hypothetical protein PHV32_11110 [Eubacteriales bacterium]|nr:hypothetical protein [Eubacteriales bacterium]